MEPSVVLTITGSRIQDGYVALPVRFAEAWLPSVRSPIFVFLDEHTDVTTLSYVPPSDAAKESRVYGLGKWFREQGVQAGDRLVVTVLDRIEKQYAAHLLDSTPVESVDRLFAEGHRRAVVHVTIERNQSLVAAKKARVVSDVGRLTCEVCAFDFFEAYGPLGAGFAECHHRIPLATLGRATSSRLDDLAVVCANCHRMLHRAGGTSVEALRQLVAERRRAQSTGKRAGNPEGQPDAPPTA